MAILKLSHSRSTKNTGNDVVTKNFYDAANKHAVEEVVEQQEELRDEQNCEVAKDSGREETTEEEVAKDSGREETTEEDDHALSFLGNLFTCNCGSVYDVAANDDEEATPKVDVEMIEDGKEGNETDEAKAENEGGETVGATNSQSKKASKKEAMKAAWEEAKKAAAARKQEQIAAVQAKRAAKKEAKKEAAARKQAQIEAKKAAKAKNKQVMTDPPTVKSTKNDEEASIGKLLKQLEADQKQLNEIEMTRAKIEENLLSTKKKIQAATTDAELDAILHIQNENQKDLLSLNTSSKASSPRRWKKGGRDNELSDIIKSFDEKDDNEVVLDETVGVEAVEEDAAAGDVEETPKGGEVEMSDGAAADSEDVPVCEETCVGADDSEDKKEAQDGEEKENEEEEVPVTEEAVVTSPAKGEGGGGAAPATEEQEQAEDRGLEMPDDDKDVGRKSLLKLSKTKPHKPKPMPRTPKKAIFDDIPDDDSEASIEVLFRYMGCTQEAYGERYQNPTISASETVDTVNTMHTTGTYEDNDNDVIENIETIGTTGGDDDTKETTNTDTKETADTDETTDDDDDDLLRSPSGTLLITDENDNEEATEPMDIGDTPNDEQLDDTTPNDEQLDDTTPQLDVSPTDKKLNVTTPDEQSNGADEPSRAVDENVTEEQTSSTAAQPVFTRLAVDTKAAVSDKPPQIDPKSAARDKVVARVINSAKSPSVRKIALALQNAPKYPTTDYTAATNQVTECSEKENAGDSGSPSATKKEEKNAKEVNTKGALAGPAATLKASGSLSKVEEMDALIKSTRAWLHTQKAERKVMDNITAKAASPTNARNAALPEMKKLETSLPETKSPSLTKIPLSPQPLSPRTLDSLLLSRKTAPSSGPKKSILEQLEEIRAKQRERESRAISPRSP